MSERSGFSKLEMQIANFCNLRLFANQFVCSVLTDLLARFCWKLIYMYVTQWCMSEILFFFKITIGNCKFMQLTIFLQINVWSILIHFFKKLRYMYVLRWRMSAIIDLFEITIGSCKFMQLMIFCKYICVHDFGWSTNPILLKIDILVCHTMIHVWNNRFFKITIW